jgi:outer membrane protein
VIADIAKANGYSYVFRKEALIVSPPADDILPLIKKKFEVAPKPAAPAAK